MFSIESEETGSGHAAEREEGVSLGFGSLAERALRGLPVGFALYAAPSGRFLYANGQLSEILGVHLSTLRAKGLGDYDRFVGTTPDGRSIEPGQWPVARALRGEEVDGEVLIIPRRQGGWTALRAWTRIVRDDEGRPVAVLLMVQEGIVSREIELSTRDAETRVRSLLERVARRSEQVALLERDRELLDTIFDATSDALVVFDHSAHVIRANSVAERTFGRPLAGLTPEQLVAGLEITVDGGNLLSADELRSFLRSDSRSVRRMVRIRTGGSVAVFEAVLSPFRFGMQPGGAIIAARNVTDREGYVARSRDEKLRAEALAERLARIHALTLKLAAALDEQEIVTLVVEQAHAALPNGAVTLLGVLNADRSLLVVSATHGIAETVRRQWGTIPLGARLPMAEVIRTGAPLYTHSWEEFEARFPGAAAELRARALPLLQATATFPLSVHQETIGSIAITYRQPQEFPESDQEYLTTIASQCALAIARARLVRDLHREAEDRERVMAVLAHDLRTPLGAIQLTTEKLSRIPQLREGIPTFERLKAISQRMNQMVQELFEFSSVRHGGMILHRHGTDLAELTSLAVAEAQQLHPAARIETRVQGNTWGEWDPIRLQQALANLLGNAIRHGDPSTPIQVAVVGGEGEVRAEVRNRGAPIPGELIPVLFEPFRRGTTQTGDERAEGLGLGLYITQQIAQAHRGSVSVNSTERETCFSLRLPRRSAGSPLVHSPP